MPRKCWVSGFEVRAGDDTDLSSDRPDCSTGRGSWPPALLADASRARAEHAARSRIFWVLRVQICDCRREHDVG